MRGEVLRASSTLERHVPNLSPLSPQLAEAVDANATAVAREPGAVLFDGGQPARGVLVVETGTVRVSLVSAGGRCVTLYRLGPGELCMLTLGHALGDDDFPARGQAETPVRGWLLSPAIVDRLVAEAPAFRAYVFASFATRLRCALRAAAAIAFEPLDRRLANALLARLDGEARAEIVITHQALADELGCTREAASRVLEALAAGGALELGRGRVRVRQRLTLEKLARE
jgi:CRP/FNR family transcriptional regulator